MQYTIAELLALIPDLDHPAIRAAREYLISQQGWNNGLFRPTDEQIFQVIRIFVAEHPVQEGQVAAFHAWLKIIDAIFPQYDSKTVADIFHHLQGADLLSEMNFRNLIEGFSYLELAVVSRILNILQRNQLQESFCSLTEFSTLNRRYLQFDLTPYLKPIEQFSIKLEQMDLLSHKSFFEVCDFFMGKVRKDVNWEQMPSIIDSRIKEIDASLDAIQEINFLTTARRDAIKEHDYPISAVIAMRNLGQAGILTEENFDLVVWHCNPESATKALICLNEVGLINHSIIRDAIKAHNNPINLANVLIRLHRVGIFTPDNPGNLINDLFANDGILLTSEMTDVFWSKIFDDDLKNNWGSIVIRCSQPEPLSHISEFVRNLNALEAQSFSGMFARGFIPLWRGFQQNGESHSLENPQDPGSIFHNGPDCSN